MSVRLKNCNDFVQQFADDVLDSNL